MDLGSHFDRYHLLHLLEAIGIERLDSVIESHNELGASKKYYKWVSCIFPVLADHYTLKQDDLFFMDVH